MTSVAAFDFDNKQLTRPAPADVPAAVAAGQYCWVDCEDCDAAAAVLTALGVPLEVTERIRVDQRLGNFRLSPNCIHCAFVEAAMGAGRLELTTLHVVLGRGFMVTLHTNPSRAIVGIMETFEQDFYETARSGGYLLFELADHLITEYREVLVALTDHVEGLQESLLGDIGDEILTLVSELTRALLRYRNAVVTTREVIEELATRRSEYVNPSTQPFLERQTVPLDRLASDASTERTVLSETLQLYMGLVSHRTNRVVNRLTVVSMVFLPLNFMAAVYGMNFENIPELGWRYSYYVFWLVALGLVAGLLLLMRKKRWF